ncbi:hypothetical protein ACHAPU_002737 [Fusarium lateritium]
MIANTVILAALAAGAAAGPCRPGALSSNTDTVTSDSTVIATSVTSAATTTEAATTASPPDPEEGAIIFGINHNIRRSKRDITFIGSDDSSCTGASLFRLSKGQLLENGVPIFWSGQGYQNFAAQGGPHNDALTTTFSVVDEKLSWANNDFGEAGFCQDQSGQVLITFGTSPSGCESVSLTVYKEIQCQNGQIVELEPSTSEATAPTVSSDETSTTPGVNPTETITSAATTTSIDACLLGVGGINGFPPREDRIADCSALYTVTVSPYTITSTILKREIAVRIPTGKYTGQPVINTLARRAEGDETATTIQPTEVPTYASYCDSPSEYYEACFEAGITGFTTTLPTPTTSTSSTMTDCPMRKMVKRAGEAAGYKYEENWEAYNMPGYKLF